MTSDRRIIQALPPVGGLSPDRRRQLAEFLAGQQRPSGVTPFAGAADVGSNLINAFLENKRLGGEQTQETARQSEIAQALAGTTVEGPVQQGQFGPGAPVNQPATLQSIGQALAQSKDPQLQQFGLQQQLGQLGRQEQQQGILGQEERAEQRQIRTEERASKRGGAGFTLGNTRFDAQGNVIASVEGGAAPPGFRAVEGGLEAIPGGPASIAAEKRIEKQALVEQKIKLNREGQQLKATNSIRAAERAQAFLQEKKRFIDPTGLAGQVTRIFGGTDAAQLDKLIEPIRANLGFDELQKMRAASPTGGALGQVAVRELELLQSTLVNLDITQQTPFLEQALNDVVLHFDNWLSAVNQAEEEGDVGSLSDEELRAIAGGE